MISTILPFNDIGLTNIRYTSDPNSFLLLNLSVEDVDIFDSTIPTSIVVQIYLQRYITASGITFSDISQNKDDYSFILSNEVKGQYKRYRLDTCLYLENFISYNYGGKEKICSTIKLPTVANTIFGSMYSIPDIDEFQSKFIDSLTSQILTTFSINSSHTASIKRYYKYMLFGIF